MMAASLHPPENPREVGPPRGGKRVRPYYPVKSTAESKRYPPVRVSKTVLIKRGVPSENVKRNVDSGFGNVVVFKPSGGAINGDVKGTEHPSPRYWNGIPVCRDFPPGCTSYSPSTSSGSAKRIYKDTSSSGVNVDSLRIADKYEAVDAVVSKEKCGEEDKRNGCGEKVVTSQRSGVGRDMIKVTLKRFWEVLDEIKKSRGGSGIEKNVYYAAVEIIQKQQRCVNTTSRQGPVSGIEVGDMFQCRAELFVIGLHRQLQKGIDIMKFDGCSIAISVIASSRYDDDMRFPGFLIYSGEGGNPRVRSKKPVDQKLTGGNLALKNSIGFKNPVRVIRSYDLSKPSSRGLKRVLVYDGLYYVEKCRQERGEFGKLVFKFTLRKFPGQPELALDPSNLGKFSLK